MGVSDMVDVGSFHQHDLFFHLLVGNDLTFFRVGLMAVNSFKFNCFSIDIEITASQTKLIICSFGIF